MSISNGISLHSAKMSKRLRAIIRSFMERSVADGAEIEGIKCANRKVASYPFADGGRVLFDAYNVRVVAASGSTEARTCTINELNNLL